MNHGGKRTGAASKRKKMVWFKKFKLYSQWELEQLLLYIILTITLSFLCSIIEAVLLSINPTFIKIKLKEGKNYAKSLLELKNSIDEPLIIILTLNTIAHTVGSILVGVQAKVAYSELNIENTFFKACLLLSTLIFFHDSFFYLTLQLLLFLEKIHQKFFLLLILIYFL